MARLSRLPALACLLFVLLAPQLQAKPTLHVVYTAENDIVLTCRRANGVEITDALFFNGSEEIDTVPVAGEPGDYTVDITPDTETALTCRDRPAGSEFSDPLNIFAIRQDMSSEFKSICPERVTKPNGQFLRFPCDYKPGRLRDLYKHLHWTQWIHTGAFVIVTNNDNYMIEDDYSFLVRQSEVLFGDVFYCTLRIEQCADSGSDPACNDGSFKGRALQLRPNFSTQLSVTGPDFITTASFTYTATADWPGLPDGDVEFRWTVGSDEFDCDEDEHCVVNSNSMNNNFQSTLELDTMSFPVGQTIDVNCTAYVTDSPADACTVPEATQSGSLTVDSTCFIVSKESIETQTTYAGEKEASVTLSCEYEVQQCSAYTYQWFKGNESIYIFNSPNDENVTNIDKYIVSRPDFSLQIINLDFFDNTSYHCQLSVRDTFKGRDIFIEVYDAARITRTPFAKVVKEGIESVQFVCSARGTPRPTIQWLFNGSLIEQFGLNISTDSRKKADNEITGTLQVNTTKMLLKLIISLGYSAPVTCRASNSPNTQPELLSDMTTVNIKLMDINECELELDDCDENANCTDTDDTFSCNCTEGFVGDGRSCTPDECASGDHNCPQNATCVDTADGFLCECDEEFVGICTPDECALGDHNCHQNATCVDTADGFLCKYDVGNGSIGTPVLGANNVPAQATLGVLLPLLLLALGVIILLFLIFIRIKRKKKESAEHIYDIINDHHEPEHAIVMNNLERNNVQIQVDHSYDEAEEQVAVDEEHYEHVEQYETIQRYETVWCGYEAIQMYEHVRNCYETVQTYEHVPAQTYECVPEQTYERVPTKVYERVPTKVYERVPTQVYERVPTQVYERVPTKVYESVSAKVYERVPTQVYESVPTQAIV